jgi:hypothetical protein
MNEGQSFEANSQSLEVVQPGDRSFDNPIRQEVALCTGSRTDTGINTEISIACGAFW